MLQAWLVKMLADMLEPCSGSFSHITLSSQHTGPSGFVVTCGPLYLKPAKQHQ